MSKLSDIKVCHVCNGTNLITKTDILIPDIFTDEDIYRNIVFCKDCETMHYIVDGEINYEFSCKVNKNLILKNING